jgi:hypothetical protein
LVKDGLLEIRPKLVPTVGGSIFTDDEYHLTDADQEFVGHLRGNEPVEDLVAWAEDYCPNGRHIYYESDEPDAFAATIRADFGLDVISDQAWGQIIDDDGEGPSRPAARQASWHISKSADGASSHARTWRLSSAGLHHDLRRDALVRREHDIERL